MSSLVVLTAVTVVVGYVVGSLPVAVWVGRRSRQIDLRDVGDRNPGWWNARANLGERTAVWVLVGDTAKGAAASGLGLLLAATHAGADDWWLGYVGAGAAMVGHAWPVFAGFRGGRSVLTLVGGLIVNTPLVAAASLGLMVLAGGLTRRLDVAARVGVFSVPLVQLLVEGPVRTAATGALMTFVGLRFAQAAWQERAVRASAGADG